MNSTELLTACNEKLSYDPVSGIFLWKIRVSKKVQANSIAGNIGSNGYRYIGITCNGKYTRYAAHRLAWLITVGNLPTNNIDHINGIRIDNRLCNLREATHSENQHNRPMLRNNTSGFKGVSYHKAINKFAARISLDGKSHYLGYFTTPEKAHQAYCKAAKELHGVFANVR